MKLNATFHAMGAIEARTGEEFTGGWSELVSVRLETFVETGARLGLPIVESDAHQKRS